MSKTRLEREREEVAKLVDGLGRPIDPEIFETVVALRMHGIHTIGSCGGHVDRYTGGPYVMFEASSTPAIRAQYRTIADKKSSEFIHLHEQAVQANIPEVRKMLDLLAQFYGEYSSHNDQHLIVRSFDASVGELLCQSAETGRILSKVEYEALLLRNHAEMQAFTQFLIAKLED